MDAPAVYLTDGISARRYRSKEIQAARAWLASNGVVLGDLERKSLGLYLTAVSAMRIAARATSFHLITTFRDLADHVGLVPAGIVSFTGNSPSGGLPRHFAYPYESGLHVARQLFPRVPFYRLGRTHRLGLAWRYHASAENCPSYFCGLARPRAVLSVCDSLSIHVSSPAEMPPPALPTLRQSRNDSRTS